MRGSVRGRSIRVLLGISVFWLALSMVSDGLSAIVLPVYVIGMVPASAQATTLGVVTFLGIFIGMLVQPLAGQKSDELKTRWGRRGTLAIGVALILGSLAILGAAASLPFLLFGYIMVQISANVAQAAQQGYIPDLIPESRRGVASGFKGFMDLGGALLGFAILGGLLVGGASALPLLALAVVVLATFLAAMALVREPPPSGATVARARWFEAFRLGAASDSRLRWLIISRFLFLLGVFSVGRFFFFFAVDRLGLDPDRAAGEVGALLAALALFTLLAAPPAGWAADRFGRRPLMVLGAGLSALGVLLLIGARDAFQLLAFGALMSVGSATFAAGNWAATADLAPPHAAGRLMGIANFGTAGAAAAAGLFGPLVDWSNGVASGTGYPVLLSSACVTFILSAIVLRPHWRRAAIRGEIVSSPDR